MMLVVEAAAEAVLRLMLWSQHCVSWSMAEGTWAVAGPLSVKAGLPR